MSLADLHIADSPHHHLRSSTSQNRLSSANRDHSQLQDQLSALLPDDHTLSSSSFSHPDHQNPHQHQWGGGEWNRGMSPEFSDQSLSNHQAMLDSLGDFIGNSMYQNDFTGCSSGSSMVNHNQAHDHEHNHDHDHVHVHDHFSGLGLGLDSVHIESSSSSNHTTMLPAESDFNGVGSEDAGDDLSASMRTRSRLQSRSAKSQVPKSNALRASATQPYPLSSPQSSPTRARSSSFRVQLPPNLQLSTSGIASAPISPFATAFRQPLTPNAATMDPSHSLRSSSPSSNESANGGGSGSRLGSSSAASSTYGGEAGTTASAPTMISVASAVASSATTTSAAPILQRRASHQGHSRRPSSPTKGTWRSNRKLKNKDRKEICLYRDAHPVMKQDVIGEHFGVERSTVSKILKFREKWLAIGSDDEDDTALDNTNPIVNGFPGAETLENSLSQLLPSPSVLNHEQQQQQRLPVSSASLDDYASRPVLGSSASYQQLLLPSDGVPRISGGRFPVVDNELASWAREVAQHGRVLSDEELLSKAREIARGARGCEHFRGSLTWLEGFKTRAGFRDGAGLVSNSPTGMSNETPQLSELESGEQYEQLQQQQQQLHPQRREVILAVNEWDLDAETALKRSASASSRSRRQLSRQLEAWPPTIVEDSSVVHGESTMGGMDVDSKTPHKFSVNGFTLDPESTPTHSTIHSRSSSAAAHNASTNGGPSYSSQVYEHHHDSLSQSTLTNANSISPLPSRPPSVATPSQRVSLAPLSMSAYSPSMATPGSPYYGYSNAPFGDPYNLSSQQPLHSPFLNDGSSNHQNLSNFINSQLPLSGQGSGSGTNSPIVDPFQHYQHHRSGSTASTTSSYSGLTAFSSNQNGVGTPLTSSQYGSFSTCNSNSGSLPSTPAAGYYRQNSSGGGSMSQTQLKAAFVAQPSSATSVASSSGGGSGIRDSATSSSFNSNGPVRRATISGGSPFNPASSYWAKSSSSSSSSSPQTVSFEQAYLSIQTALEYLTSAGGQAFATPKDIILLSDLKGKMLDTKQKLKGGGVHSQQQQQQQQQQEQQQQHGNPSLGTSTHRQQRLRLARTQSTNSIVGLNHSTIGTRRSGSTVSLLQSLDAASTAVGR